MIVYTTFHSTILNTLAGMYIEARRLQETVTAEFNGQQIFMRPNWLVQQEYERYIEAAEFAYEQEHGTLRETNPAAHKEAT